MSKATPLNGGLSNDLGFQNHPKESPRFVLNGIRDNSTGDRYAYQSEPGNAKSGFLKEGYSPIGQIYGQDQENFIFSTNGSDSEIGLLLLGSYTELVNDANQPVKFNFDSCHAITGEYKVRNGCERILYWSDGLNPDRFVNVDDLNDFRESINGPWDVDKFRLRPIVQVPNINVTNVNDGGGVNPVGVYYFVIEILDNAQNVLFTSAQTKEVAIYDDSVGDSYNQIDGAYNILTHGAGIGGVPLTSKSITIEISNLDISYDFVRVNVLRAITGDGVTIDAVRNADLIPINKNTSVNYTYTGYNPSGGDQLVDPRSLLDVRPSYITSQYMEQVQNRLARINISDPYVDYSTFQKEVNKITASYIVDEVDARSQLILGNPKNSLTWQDHKTHMGDEIYAYGIVYVYDGFESPAFHIPGRAPFFYDIQELSVIPTSGTPSSTEVRFVDVEHLGVNVGDSVPRWKAINTADTSVNRMAYWEADNAVYPTTLDCDGNFIYGTLAGNPVRHHKFPCRRQEALYADGDIRILGIEFDNIIYPDPNIIGHYFVRAKRDEFNRTILDKGVLFGAYRDENAQGSTGDDIVGGTTEFFNDATNASFAYFPRTTFNSEYLNGSYLKFEHQYVPASSSTIQEDISGDNVNFLISNIFDSYGSSNLETPETLHRTYNGNILVSPRATQSAVQGFTNDIRNLSYSSGVAAINLNSAIDAEPDETSPGGFGTTTLAQDPFLVANKVVRDIHSNITRIIYYRTHNGVLTLDSDQSVYGDAFISALNIANIVQFEITDNIAVNDNYIYQTRYDSGFWLESEVNVYMRHEGTDTCNQYFKGDQNIAEYFLDKVAEDLGDGYIPRAEVCTEFYAYNKDYSRVACDTVYVTLPEQFNYCSDCLNDYTNRIVYSPQSFDEDLADYYRVNLVDDYIDSPAHRGKLVAAKYVNNKLYVHAIQTTFEYYPNPQFLATDQGNAYLDSGDFLAIPPNELKQTDNGYGGLQDKLAINNNEYGYNWVDGLNGRVINLDKGNLSEQGLSKWLQNNLYPSFNEVFKKSYGIDYPCRTVTDSNGIGTICTYDPYYRRLVIHVKNFRPTKRLINKPGITETMYYDIDNNQFLVTDNNSQSSYVATFENTDAFENLSFTITYSFKHQGWNSWHSYLPNFMFNDDQHYYTTILGDKFFWQHQEKGQYQTYYGKKHDFIVEYVMPAYENTNLHSVYYIGDTKQWQESSKQWKQILDSTFNKMVVYNTYQSTGLQQVALVDQHNDPYNNIFYDNLVKKCIRTDNNYKISSLYDISTDHPVITSDWDLIQNDFYIDHIPQNIDFDKPFYDYKEFNDKYAIVRLFFNPINDYAKTIYLFVNNEFPSSR